MEFSYVKRLSENREKWKELILNKSLEVLLTTALEIGTYVTQNSEDYFPGYQTDR